MLYVVWGFILLLAIGTFVAAYYASRTWHWANVTCVVLVLLLAIFYILLGARVIEIRSEYGRQIAESTEQLEDLQARIEALRSGSDDSQVINRMRGDEIATTEEGELAGIADLEHRLQMRTRIRGRVWRGAGPTEVDPDTGAISVAVPQPAPHGIEENTVIQFFEQGPPAEGRQYLGEFLVVEAAEGGVRVQPTLALDDRQQERLDASNGPWALHETMPVDEHEIFEPLGDEQLQQLLPEETVEQYVRHGGERTDDDDQWHVTAFDDADQRLGPESANEAENVRYAYRRSLRDYGYLFQEFAQQRALMLAELESVNQDIAQLQRALDGAQQLQAFREDEIEKLNVDLAGLQKDRQAIEQHLARLQRQIHIGQTLVERTIRENARRARELAEFQGVPAPAVDQQASIPDLVPAR